MDNKLVFHIGLPKTASTHFQHNIFPELENYVFVCAPFTQESVAFNKLQYADDVLFEPDELIAEVTKIATANPGMSILVSDENLFGAPNANFMNRTQIARRLSQLWPSAEVVIFIRDQRSLVRSIYNQFVKNGSFGMKLGPDFISKPGQGLAWEDYIRTPPKWTREFRYIDYQAWMSREHFFYDEILPFYERTFSSVHVVLYEDVIHRPYDVLQRLEKIFGAKFSERAYSSFALSRKNSSLTERELAAKLIGERINPVSRVLGRKMTGRISAFFARYYVPSLRESMESHLRTVFTDEEMVQRNWRVNERYGLGMERYSQLYFPGEKLVKNMHMDSGMAQKK